MAEAAGPGDAFAIGDDAQYRPVAATGPPGWPRNDQHVRGLARAAGLAAERTREIVFAGSRGQPRA
jgi:hypothetical protein